MSKDKEKKEEVIDFLSRLVEPHEKKSREVTEKDLSRVIEESKVLYNLCYTQFDRYAGALAMAHPQIDDKDPLRLFVLANKEVVINPVIVNHTRHAVESKEGCITFYHLPQKIVERYHRIQVSYVTLNKEATGFTERRTVDLSGRDSFVWQHEIDHLDAKYIYPATMSKKNLEKDIEKIKEDGKVEEAVTGIPSGWLKQDNVEVEIDKKEDDEIKSN